MRGTKNTWKIVVVSIIAAAIIIFSGYAYGSYKENKFLAEDSGELAKQQEETKSEETPTTDFAEHRDDATIAEYLAYVHQENQTVNISAITNMGDTREWLKEGLTQVAGQIDMDKSRLNYSEHPNDRVNSAQLLEDTDWEAIANEQAELTMVVFPNAADYRDGVEVSDSIDNAREIYRNLRIASPNTQVLFLTVPAESDQFNSDATYRERVQQFNDGLNEAGMNSFDLVNGENALIDQEFEKYNDDGLTPDSYEHLVESLVKQLSEQKMALTLGFNGDNDAEIEQLQQEAEEARAREEQEAAEAEADAQAAQQRAAEEETARQREAERQAQEAAEAEAARQREEQAAQEQQAQQNAEQNVPNQMDPNAVPGAGNPGAVAPDAQGGQAGAPQTPAGNGQAAAGAQ